MTLPKRLRSLVPDGVRDDPRLRALAVGSGLIPPRTMHSAGEAALLARLARDATLVVEIGVYEGSSALVLVEAMTSGPPARELHLIDPFGHHPDALRAGWGATEWATRRAVARAARRAAGGVDVVWHVAMSADVARGWSAGPVDLVFVDGDHSEAGAALDWEAWAPHVRPGGAVVFHDARQGVAGGVGLPGPTAVVDRLVRPAAGWEVVDEVDAAVAVRRVA
jgi:predicted O-methyltransferase YrrM